MEELAQVPQVHTQEMIKLWTVEHTAVQRSRLVVKILEVPGVFVLVRLQLQHVVEHAVGMRVPQVMEEIVEVAHIIT